MVSKSEKNREESNHFVPFVFFVVDFGDLRTNHSQHRIHSRSLESDSGRRSLGKYCPENRVAQNPVDRIVEATEERILLAVRSGQNQIIEVRENGVIVGVEFRDKVGIKSVIFGKSSTAGGQTHGVPNKGTGDKMRFHVCLNREL